MKEERKRLTCDSYEGKPGENLLQITQIKTKSAQGSKPREERNEKCLREKTFIKNYSPKEESLFYFKLL